MKQKEFREAEGMSAAEFARRIGIHLVTAYKYERGRVPSPPVMRRIRDAFPKITLEDYLGGGR